MMTHTSSSQTEHGKIAYGGTNNGIVAKHIRFLGKAAHAGGAPHAGINAPSREKQAVDDYVIMARSPARWG